MRSVRRFFSVFALSLIFCFAITTPRIALAEWREYVPQGVGTYNASSINGQFSVARPYNSNLRDCTVMIVPEINGYVSPDSRNYAYWNTNPSSSTFDNIVMVPVGPSLISKGTRFKVITDVRLRIHYAQKASPGATDYNTAAIQTYGLSYWVSKANNTDTVRVYADSNGVITAPFDLGYVFIVKHVHKSDLPQANGRYWNAYEWPKLHIYYPEDFNEVEAIEQQTIDIGEQTQQQTDTLMDTSGSDGVMSSATGVQNRINSKLGFVSQSASMITGLYDSLVNVTPTNYVTFPELKFQNYVIIPETQVALLGWIPEIEQPIRMFITGVFVLAWLHGVKVIYGKMFLGETEVITDGEQ